MVNAKHYLPKMIVKKFILAALAIVSAASSCVAFKFTIPGGMAPIIDFEHNIPNCDDIPPESAGPAQTSCYSSCAKTITDDSLQCNPQAENYQYRLSLNQATFKETHVGERGCQEGYRRYLCTSEPSNGHECESVKTGSMKDGGSTNPYLVKFNKHMPPELSGDQCYTKCGATFCPTQALAAGKRFRDIIPKYDFKITNCEFGSHRLRCAVQIPPKIGVLPAKKIHPLHGATLEL